MNKFKGTGVALITPFDAAKNVDYIALEKLVNFQIDNGINYLVVLGTTGESTTLNNEERQQVIKTIVRVNNNRLPLVLGIGGNNTQQAITDIKNADLSDFDAILSVSPFYNKPTQEGIYQHFKTIANSTDKNIILYNVPHRTGKNVDPKTIVRLANDCKNIIGVKDAASDIQQTLEILRTKPKDFLVISGDDSLALIAVLAGGDGVISVLGQGVPTKFTEMINLGLQGESKDAFALYYQLKPLTELIFQEGNPAGIKVVLNQQKICDTEVRLPLLKASNDLYDAIVLTNI